LKKIQSAQDLFISLVRLIITNKTLSGSFMKSVKHFILSATLMTGLAVQSPRSEALVAFTVPPSFAVMFPLIVGGSYVTVMGLASGGKLANWTLLAGILILDKESNELQLTEIPPESAPALDLTSTEYVAYNSELEKINLALSEMNSTVSNATAENLEAAKTQSLAKFQSEISPASFRAVQKVLKASVRK
jgi:hypothetical protein